MFWSPAVMTVSVTFCCAGAGNAASVSRETAAPRLAIDLMEPSLSKDMTERPVYRMAPLRICGVEMKRLEGQPDADGLAHGQAPLVVDEKMIVADLNAVAPDAAGIGRLGDTAAQHE